MSSVSEDSRNNRHQHEILRLELQQMQVALESLAAYSEAIANLRSLRDVTERLNSLLADMPAHFVHEERTILNAIEAFGPEEARFAHEMREQHRVLSTSLARFFEMLSEIHDSNDIRAALADLRTYGARFSRLLLSHIDVEESKLQAMQMDAQSSVAS